MERGHELRLLSEAGLQGQQSEEEMAISGGSHDMAPIVVGRSGKGPGLRGRPRDPVTSGRSSLVRHPFASVPRGGVLKIRLRGNGSGS